MTTRMKSSGLLTSRMSLYPMHLPALVLAHVALLQLRITSLCLDRTDTHTRCQRSFNHSLTPADTARRLVADGSHMLPTAAVIASAGDLQQVKDTGYVTVLALGAVLHQALW